MKNIMILLVGLLAAPHVFAEAKVDAPAPAFSEKDQTGKAHSLADFKGKWVVLEWYNKDCPYVKKHYGSKNMQTIQEEAKAKGVVWLTINSGAKGKQGYLDAAGTLADMKSSGSNATAVLIDEDGSMGKAYGAKTTPHMFVINPEGQVVYAGAIDDNDSSSPKVIAKSQNYIKQALEAGLNGKPLAVKSTKPYGCSVKY